DPNQMRVESGPEQGWIDRPGGVFLRRADLMPPEDVLLLRATARAVMDGDEGELSQQLVRQATGYARLPEIRKAKATKPEPAAPAVPAAPPDLESFNGLGG